MTTPRRRLVRPTPAPPAIDRQRQRRLQRLRDRLAREGEGLTRWMSRVKRAFHAIERLQASIARAERQLTQKEKP